jgi:DtxR family Mn-dependent transcriptional regulator
LEIGQEATVSYILTKKHPQLHKLMSFGILPGTKIKIHQKSPSYVISVGETQIALEEGLLSDIYIRK